MLKEFVQRLARLLPTRRAMMEAEVSASASEVVEKKVGDDVHKNHEEDKLHHVKDGRIEKPKTDEDPERKRVKTFRYAMLVGYQGKNYFGMQVQKKFTAPTIEGHILDALLKNKWITQAQFDRPFDFFFQRAARTDKAVSAVRQICSMQLPRMDDLSVDGAAKMNDHLPADIRVFGFRRTTKSFHSQKDCDARTYSYTLPTFAFAKPHEKTDASFRITPETRAEIDEVLDIYKGTHNFFNYTSRKCEFTIEFDDRSCFRYIMEFKCGEPFLFKDEVRGGDVEFITVTVKGQSFILHQIRKMMGMTISVVRELQNKSAIQRSFESKRMDVPKAPGLGLLLERLHFHNYDKRFGSQSHEPLSNWGEMIEQQVEEMKMKYITKEIMDTEIREQSMMRWLADLILHSFSVDPEAEEVEKGAFVCRAAAKAKEALEAAKAEAAPVNGDAKTEESAPESSEECNEKKVAPVEVAST